jgi:signal transduction histidine kinase
MGAAWIPRGWHGRALPVPGPVEAVLAALLSAVPIAAACGAPLNLGTPRPGAVACLAVVAMTLPAAWARPLPLGAVSVMIIATAANGLLFGHAVRCGVALPAALIVAFAIGARLGWPRMAIGLALCAADVAIEGYYDPQIGGQGLSTVIPAVLAFFALGCLVRARSRTARALRAASEQLRQEREETTRLALQADRAALSAAINDSLRDRLDAIADTAAAGLRPTAGGQGSAAADREAVRRSLAAIEHDGRAALGELRAVVGGLREPAADSAPASETIAPQPTLAGLPELLHGLPSARARLTIDGQPRPLPATLELSGYRIVEHLVQALADEPGAVIEVRLGYSADTLELRVQGAPARGDSLRSVVAAARQRATLHGGTLDSRLDDGVCHATATLPLISGYA